MGRQALKYNPHQLLDPSQVSYTWDSNTADVEGTVKSLESRVYFPMGDLPASLRVSSTLQTTHYQGSTIADPLLTSVPSGSPSRSEHLEPIVIRQKPKHPEARFITLQKWEGMVEEVSQQSFIALLTDRTNSGPDQEAEFDLEEIDISDRALVKPGAVFYWSLGYNDSPSGQRTRMSILRFRRLPIWREQELKKYSQQAKELAESIDWK